MSLILEKLPKSALISISYFLEPEDIFQLALASKHLWRSLNDQELWQNKCTHDFGDLFGVVQIIVSVGLELSAESTPYMQEPTNWRRYYIQKNEQSRKLNADTTATETQVQMAENDFIEARELVQSFQENQDISVLSKATRKLIAILDMFPGHAGCYHLLAFILYVLNKLDDALVILAMGRIVDPEYEPIDELEDEIHNIIKGYEGDEEEEALLDGDALSAPLNFALSQIFDQFNVDGDDALSPLELDQFIFRTNGYHPPAPLLSQMGQKFGANQNGWLTRKGFLSFYLEQTLSDPSETRRDLEVHGFNGKTLQLMTTANADDSNEEEE